MEIDHPLMALNGQKLDHYQLRIDLKPLRSRQGWVLFSLYLEDQRGGFLTIKGQTGNGFLPQCFRGYTVREEEE